MGTLKAKVGGIWTPVAGNPQATADLARWNSAWGEIYSWTLTSGPNISLSTTTALIQQITTSPVPAGRKILVSVQTGTGPTVSAADSEIFFDLTDASDTVLRRVRTFNPTSNTKAGPLVAFSYRLDTTGSSPLVFKLKSSVSTGTGALSYSSATEPMTIVITDIGPVAQAAVAPPAATPRVVASGNALGIIGMGAFIPPVGPRTVAVSVETALTYALPFFAAVGRRYRVRFQARAIANTAAAGSISFYLRDNGTVIRGWPGGGDPYTYVTAAYTGVSYDWLFDGDGLQHSVELLCNGIAMSIYVDTGLWYVEDMGPNSVPALPIPETPPAWTALTLASGWTFAGIWDKPAYRKIGDLVHVRGFAMMTTTSPPSTIATLPVGFRPPAGNIYGTIGGDTPQPNTFTRVQITSNGNIGFAGGPTLAVNNWVSLSLPPFSTTA